MKNKILKCKTCGADIAANAKLCPSCGAKNKKPVYKRVCFWILISILVIIVVSVFAAEDTSDYTDVEPESSSEIVEEETENHAFDGDCGIAASGSLGSSIIGYPELTIHVKNTTGKTISAIQFYCESFNVYGEKLDNWDAGKRLYTDDKIYSNSSAYPTWQLIDNEVKTVKIYVYSVYFSDGSEWGDKNASIETIEKYAREVKVSGEA